MKVTLDLEVHEAQMVLGKLSEAGEHAHRTAAFLFQTGAPRDEQEIADYAARVWDRLERALVDKLYPTCLFMHEDEPCGKESAGYFGSVPYCRFHLELERRYAPVSA